MARSNATLLLIVTGVVEFATGIVVLGAPSLVTHLLLGTGLDTTASMVVARVAGAALVAIGLNCLLDRNLDHDVQAGLLAGLAVYNAAVVVTLVYAATVDGLRGIALWPACILHMALLIWCARCLAPGARVNLQ